MFLKINQISVVISVYVVLISFFSEDINSQIPYVKPDGEKIDIKDFRGTQYLEEDFQKGVVYDGLAGSEKDMFLRYDALNDLFEMKKIKTEKNNEFLKKTFEINISLDTKKFYCLNYRNNDGNDVFGYLQEIATIGDMKFYRKYGKKLILPQKAKTTLEQDRPGKIKNKKYYVVGISNDLKAAEINKKLILNYIKSDKKASAKAFVKKNKLKFKDYKDIEKLADFLQKS